MPYELREGQGSLFRNDKRDNDRAPNARGEALIGGVLYEIASWTKEGRKGKFQSLSIKPKEQRREQPPRRQSYAEESGGSYGRQPDDMGEDEILF
jgi:hypothetical protein